MRQMESLVDPLKLLKRHKATPTVTTDASGEKCVILTFEHTAHYHEKRKAEQVLRRFERLILMQIDVAPGQLPRTVQKLVASGKLLVVDGRYVAAGERKKPPAPSE